MRTLFCDDFSRPLVDRSVVAIGNFDGVHRGHRELFRQLRSLAHSHDAQAVVVTFNPHPLRVLQPDNRRFSLITTFEQKRDLIAESDIDLLLVIPFTTSFAAVSAEQFVGAVLHGALGAVAVVIGHDYAFGKGREGNEALLRQMGAACGFTVLALDPVGEGGQLFSSSAVRQLVGDGQVRAAMQILGRCHRVCGPVVRGRRIGRSLGFPTANIVSRNELLPQDGVYAVWVEVQGELRMGACSIGLNPTFAGGERTVEVFLLDFDRDIYDQELVLHFVDKVRDLARFADAGALISQINADLQVVRRILASGLPLVSA